MRNVSRVGGGTAEDVEEGLEGKGEREKPQLDVICERTERTDIWNRGYGTSN